jgi:hypothetical protein
MTNTKEKIVISSLMLISIAISISTTYFLVQGGLYLWNR